MGGGRVVECNTKAEWDAQLAAAGDKAVIVDFSAVWCGPCQMIGPVFVQLSEQYPDLVFLKVDVDANADVAATCGISAMPTFQVWKNGAKVDEFVGAAKDKLKAFCEKYA
ncbi:thioredoxin H-type [Raphidocelis subcapitata]|uniref:Thioredoxin n=1 Tax=Raphidocelis subcapitata TaxID=307507 RepID=A0A2V0PF13_9CHLO|nr:thioredoxin H-type [Raphidocelis subcapitata]|eukprot:GBF98438.1 thioredoxin H-type [Raphidocelis subcapitata]